MTISRTRLSLLLLPAILAAMVACSDPASDDNNAPLWNNGVDNNGNNGNNNGDLDASDDADPPDASNNGGNNGDLDTSPDVPDDVGPDDVGPDDVGPDGGGDLSRRSCASTVEYRGPGSSVAISGGHAALSDWSPTGVPLTRVGEVWRAEVDVEPGAWPYKFVIDGQFESSVPPDVYTQWDGGVENRSLRVADCHKPEWRALDSRVSPDGTITGRFQFVRAADDSPLAPGSVALTVGGEPVTPAVDARTEVVSFSTRAPAQGKYSIRLSGADQRGVDAENNPFYLPLWVEAEAFTWQDAVMYLVFTDRFRDSDGVDRRIPGADERANYLGGDFRGITQAIEEGYFDLLGINALWLSPIYDNTDQIYPDKNNDRSRMMTGFHGYWPISLSPEPRYGDDEASAEDRLAELTRVAHEHGIRILFDLALNQVHQDHPYCQEHPEWCSQTCICGSDNCGWDPFNGRGLDCQFDTFLPDLSYRNHAITRRVIADTLAMIERYDVDGLRIDAARHMDHVIMRTLRMTLRDQIEANGGAPYYTVGETFTDSHSELMAFVADYELHGQFDFFTRSRIRDTFVYDGSFRDLDDGVALNESPSGYGDAVWWMSPFFGNHDIDRMATIIARNDEGPWGDTVDLMAAGPADTVDQWNIINRMTLAFAFLLTSKGVPLIYYGDEIGLAGSRDPDNRRFMDWSRNANQRELLGRLQAIGQARRDLRPLRHGERRELWKDQTLYVYARWTAPGDGVIIAMNKGETSRAEAITVPAELGLEGRTLQSATSDRTFTVTGNTLSLTLAPWELVILHP